MRFLKDPKLTYANVVATLALVLAIGGGTAFAASQITSEDIAPGAVKTSKVHKRAITAGKIALGAVRGNQVADGALSSTQIKPGSIQPESLAVPLSYAANGMGGSSEIPSGEPAAYPLTNATWTQDPGEIDVVFGEAAGTLAYTGSGLGSCQVFIELRLNGRQVGGGQLETSSESLVSVQGSIGANPEVDPPSPRANTLTARVGSNGACAAGSAIDSSRYRVLAFG